MSKVLDFLSSNKNQVFSVGAVSSDLIIEAETKLQQNIPEILKEIISQYGAFSYKYIEVFGLGVEIESHNNILGVNKQLRNEENFPAGLIAFESLGDGTFALCDCNGYVLEWSSPNYDMRIKFTNKCIDEYIAEQLEQARDW